MDNELKKTMQRYAKENDVPIIEQEGLDIILKILKKQEAKIILEIGTAIGYSALCMNEINNLMIYTIERDKLMYEQAVLNIKKAKKEDEIKLLFGDALIDEFILPPKIDVLYIDAAKSQYQRFFERFEHLVKPCGIVIFDNLKFHGYVDMELEDIKSRNLRQLIRKLKNFNEYVKTIDGYDYQFIDQGDGIGILRKLEQ